MGFLDSLGDVAKKMGKSAIAAPGAVYDMAAYAVPGDQWGSADDHGYSGVGDLLDSIGHRAADMTFAVPTPVKHGLGDVMHGLNWAYHQGVDRPASTFMIELQHAGSQPTIGSRFNYIFSGEDWAKAYDIADKQALGQSTVYNLSENGADPLTHANEKVDVRDSGGNVVGQRTLTPFETSGFYKNHPFLSQAAALGIDLTASWYLDPTVLAGKAAGAYRESVVLGRIPETSRANFASRLDGSVQGSEKTFGVAQDWGGRFDSFFKYIGGENRLNRPLNAAEIRASSVELQKSSGGLAISSALEDALKLDTEADRMNAARRVFAVAAGDTSQATRLAQETAGTQALEWRLRNIINQKTVDLQAQALDRARKDSPEFRLLFNQQIAALDEGGDLTKFISGWHDSVQAQLGGQRNLLGANRTLDFMPAKHGGALGSNHKLAIANRTDALSKVEKGHDAVVARLTTLPQRDSYSSVYQQGLSTLPVVAMYPAKFLSALLPTKAVPAMVRGLRTVHYNGVVNLHDWNAASDQLNSLMIHAGVDNDTRLSYLSQAYGAHSEMDKLSVIHRIEQVAIDGVAQRIATKHGIAVDRDYVQQAMAYGQRQRGGLLSAMNGSRMYSTTKLPEPQLSRARTMAKARTAGAVDDRIAAERAANQADNWSPSVDQFLDSSGVPYSMPVVSSQLANRVPLIDIHMVNQVVGDKAFADRLERHSQAWAQLSIEKTGLESRLARATGSQFDRLQRSVANVRKMQDALLATGSFLNRWWKVGVLFRLGYPMRVLADDHMRIAARLGYVPFLMSNVGEGAKNTYYNYAPGLFGGTRRGDAARAYELLKARRAQLVTHYGSTEPHSDAAWAEIQDLHKTYLAPSGVTDAERAAAKARLDVLDPDGRVTEWADLTKQQSGLRGSVTRRRAAIAKLRDSGADAAKLREAEAALTDAEGALYHVQEQLAGRVDPAQLRDELKVLDEQLLGTAGSRGPKNFRAPKRHIGESDVRLKHGNVVPGAYTSYAQGWHEATSSNSAFDYMLTDGEEMGFRLNSAGHWRSVAPGEPGYYQLWANILNHQFQHSPEFMSIIRGEVKSPSDFTAWLAKPENRYIVDRMRHQAADPEDWGGRLLAMAEDYTGKSDPALLEAMQKGRVSARQLRRMFPEGDQRLPHPHGQMADVQSGRAGVQRAFSDGIQRAFEKIAVLPTDKLSRHPFFNAVYKREMQHAENALIAERGKGAQFGADELRQIETVARRKALGELKQTLWDVSAHSHAAHTLRFISPFFAAHQEALNRWWNIAKDDPSVARKFQLAFDAPRKAGMTYNPDTGEVQPGDNIGSVGNKIMLKLPFADEHNAVNKWLLKMGGGKTWSVNESGLNLILQNSNPLNPGVGPMVTVPVEWLVQKYPEATQFEKVARVLNQYPPSGDGFVGIAEGGIIPAWAKRVQAYYQGPKSQEFARYYMQNFADDLTTFRLQRDREPSESELKDLQDHANKQTHTDLLLMMASNLASITPAKPNSKYAAVQNGLQRLYEQMRTEGHDMEWLRDTFRAQYGDAYMAMIYSMGSNPGKLQGSVAEVSAIKKHSALMKRIDPSLARIAIGPDVAGSDKADQMYSSSAASWLAGQETGTPGENYRGKKDPRDVATSLVISQGWDQYDQLVNALDVMAEQQGLTGYEQSPDLVNAKRRGIDWIKQQNPVFAHSYDAYAQKSYDKLVDDMREIANDKQLQKDPLRSNDVYWLGQYIALRDGIQQTLKARAAQGGSKTIGAQDNADLARGFAAAVQYINSQSTYFKQFSYPIIERDPLLVSNGGQ